MKKGISSIDIGALMTIVSLFLLASAYPSLFALFGLLSVTAVVILGLSLLSVVPKVPELISENTRKSVHTEQGSIKCQYCGLTLPRNSVYCPNCGGHRK